jgi:hypothetical protein
MLTVTVSPAPHERFGVNVTTLPRLGDLERAGRRAAPLREHRMLVPLIVEAITARSNVIRTGAKMAANPLMAGSRPVTVRSTAGRWTRRGR